MQSKYGMLKSACKCCNFRTDEFAAGMCASTPCTQCPRDPHAPTNQVQVGTLLHLSAKTKHYVEKSSSTTGTLSFGPNFQSPTSKMVNHYFGGDISGGLSDIGLRPYIFQDLSTGLCSLGGVVQVKSSAVNKGTTILWHIPCVVPIDLRFTVASSTGEGAQVLLRSVGSTTELAIDYISNHEEWISLAGITWAQDTVNEPAFPFAKLTGDIAMISSSIRTSTSMIKDYMFGRGGQSHPFSGIPSVKIVGGRCLLYGCVGQAQDDFVTPGSLLPFELPEVCRQESHDTSRDTRQQTRYDVSLGQPNGQTDPMTGNKHADHDGKGTASYVFAHRGGPSGSARKRLVAIRISGVQLSIAGQAPDAASSASTVLSTASALSPDNKSPICFDGIVVPARGISFLVDNTREERTKLPIETTREIYSEVSANTVYECFSLCGATPNCDSFAFKSAAALKCTLTFGKTIVGSIQHLKVAVRSDFAGFRYPKRTTCMPLTPQNAGLATVDTTCSWRKYLNSYLGGHYDGDGTIYGSSEAAQEACTVKCETKAATTISECDCGVTCSKNLCTLRVNTYAGGGLRQSPSGETSYVPDMCACTKDRTVAAMKVSGQAVVGRRGTPPVAGFSYQLSMASTGDHNCEKSHRQTRAVTIQQCATMCEAHTDFICAGFYISSDMIQSKFPGAGSAVMGTCTLLSCTDMKVQATQTVGPGVSTYRNTHHSVVGAFERRQVEIASEIVFGLPAIVRLGTAGALYRRNNPPLRDAMNWVAGGFTYQRGTQVRHGGTCYAANHKVTTYSFIKDDWTHVTTPCRQPPPTSSECASGFTVFQINVKYPQGCIVREIVTLGGDGGVTPGVPLGEQASWAKAAGRAARCWMAKSDVPPTANFPQRAFQYWTRLDGCPGVGGVCNAVARGVPLPRISFACAPLVSCDHGDVVLSINSAVDVSWMRVGDPIGIRTVASSTSNPGLAGAVVVLSKIVAKQESVELHFQDPYVTDALGNTRLSKGGEAASKPVAVGWMANAELTSKELVPFSSCCYTPSSGKRHDSIKSKAECMAGKNIWMCRDPICETDMPSTFAGKHCTDNKDCGWVGDKDQSGYLCMNAASGCTDLPDGWMSSTNANCQQYEERKWCTADGKYGTGWLTSYGTFARWAVGGKDASQACCACGGGTTGGVSASTITHVQKCKRAFADPGGEINTEWTSGHKCPLGRLGLFAFSSTSLYATMDAAKAACKAACLARADCFFADLYSKETCYLKGAACGDWKGNTHGSYQLYRRTWSPTAVWEPNQGYQKNSIVRDPANPVVCYLNEAAAVAARDKFAGATVDGWSELAACPNTGSCQTSCCPSNTAAKTRSACGTGAWTCPHKGCMESLQIFGWKAISSLSVAKASVYTSTGQAKLGAAPKYTLSVYNHGINVGDVGIMKCNSPLAATVLGKSQKVLAISPNEVLFLDDIGVLWNPSTLDTNPAWQGYVGKCAVVPTVTASAYAECARNGAMCKPNTADICRAIVTSGYRTQAEAGVMTGDDCRNVAIVELNLRIKQGVTALQAKSTAELIAMSTPFMMRFSVDSGATWSKAMLVSGGGIKCSTLVLGRGDLSRPVFAGKEGSDAYCKGVVYYGEYGRDSARLSFLDMIKADYRKFSAHGNFNCNEATSRISGDRGNILPGNAKQCYCQWLPEGVSTTGPIVCQWTKPTYVKPPSTATKIPVEGLNQYVQGGGCTWKSHTTGYSSAGEVCFNPLAAAAYTNEYKVGPSVAPVWLGALMMTSPDLGPRCVCSIDGLRTAFSTCMRTCSALPGKTMCGTSTSCEWTPGYPR
jgi:hypothetical protein